VWDEGGIDVLNEWSLGFVGGGRVRGEVMESGGAEKVEWQDEGEEGCRE